jgi:hypothetical protein
VIAKANVIMHSNALKIGTSEGVTGKAASLLTHSASTLGVKASAITVGGGNTTINTSNAAACSVSGSGTGELGGSAVESPKEHVPEQMRGGSGGSGGGASTRAGGSTPPGKATTTPTVATEKTFIELELIDSDGQPVAFASYRITASDGAEFLGVLDASGQVRIPEVARGNCKVTFPEFYRENGSAA